MKKVKLIGTLTAVFLVIIVIFQNTQPVETTFLFTRVTLPNAVLLGLTLLIGIFIGLLISLKTSGKRDALKKQQSHGNSTTG